MTISSNSIISWQLKQWIWRAADNSIVSMISHENVLAFSSEVPFTNCSKQTFQGSFSSYPIPACNYQQTKLQFTVEMILYIQSNGVLIIKQILISHCKILEQRFKKKGSKLLFHAFFSIQNLGAG